MHFIIYSRDVLVNRVGLIYGRATVWDGKSSSGFCPSGNCLSGICPRGGNVSRAIVRSGYCPRTIFDMSTTPQSTWLNICGNKL